MTRQDDSMHIRLYRGPLSLEEKPRYAGVGRVLNILNFLPDQMHRADLQYAARGGYSDTLWGHSQLDVTIRVIEALNNKHYTALRLAAEESFWEPRVLRTADGIPPELNRVRMLFDIFGRANNVPVVWEETGVEACRGERIK